MEIGICHFSPAGAKLEEKVCRFENLSAGERIHWNKRRKQSLNVWAEKGFSQFDAMVFIGACGIATRAIAPYIRDKFTDPAVLCVDDRGRYVIPILSGHMGGANQLAVLLAEWLEAVPVVTTGTDCAGAFACDLWVKKNGLGIYNHRGIQEISSAVLRKEKVGIWSEEEFRPGTCPPRELEPEDWYAVLSALRRREQRTHILVFSSYQRAENFSAQLSLHCDDDSGGRGELGCLILYARPYIVGVGCRAGIDFESLRAQYHDFLRRHRIDPHQVLALASVDRKSREPALVSLRRQEGLSLYTRSPEELMRIKGKFHHSDFVMETLGCDNVCERAAMAVAMDLSRGRRDEGRESANGPDRDPKGVAELLLPRETGDQVTLALVGRKILLNF